MNTAHNVTAALLRTFAAVATLCGVLATVAPLAFGQGATPAKPAVSKFDEFGDLNTDDVMARLDLFAAELGKDQNLRGFIVGYRRNDFRVGPFFREIYGFQDYLVNKRGIDARRIGVMDSGVREKSTAYLTTQLWLVPMGADIPFIPAALVKVNRLIQFDSLTLGSDCGDEFTLVLEEPHEALKFFAQALRADRDAKGFVFVHPARREALSEATKLISDSKEFLSREFEGQIYSSLEGRRPCAQLDLWLAPPNIVIPQNTSAKLFFHSQLMTEAERNRYTVRRVEFLGNEHLRDKVLRRRIPGLEEGEMFTNAVLLESLASLSRLRVIDPVSVQDVEARLDREDQTIDLMIVVSERRRPR